MISIESVTPYTDNGIIVHPLVAPVQGDKSTGKAPVVKDWHSRTIPYESKFLERELSKGCNIGANCGKASDLTVIDIDYHIKGVWDYVFAGVDIASFVTQTRTNKDGKRHLMFKYNPALKTCTNQVLGFDIRNDGGNIVLAPSIHYEGDVYRLSRPIEARSGLPEIVADRINEVVDTYATLKAVLAKCRPCFYNLWKAVFVNEKSDIYHDTTIFRQAEGRFRHLYLFAELRANGAADEQLMLACWLIFGEFFDEVQTYRGLRGIDAKKTPKNATLRADEYYSRFMGKVTDNENAKRETRPISSQISESIQGSLSNPLQIAVALQERHPIYFDPSRNFWLWNLDKCCYERVDETELLCAISEAFDYTIYNSKVKTEVLEALKITGRQRRVKPPKKSWVQFIGEVFDTDTELTFNATPEYFFASPVPHRLGDSEETPIIDKLFRDWLNEKAPLLLEICAYSLLDDYPLQRIFAFQGSGSNGKSKFLELLRKLLGDSNCTGTDLERLCQSRFETAKLYKKKAAFISDAGYTTLNKTNMLKNLTGDDFVSAEFKGKDSIDFLNTAKIFIATNGLPITSDMSDGFFRRWCIAEFKNKFKDGKNIVTHVPEEEYENLCRKCLRVLKEILDLGYLPHEDLLEHRRERYEALSNPLQTFVNDECITDTEDVTPVWYLYEKYDAYRERGGHRQISKAEFTKTLKKMGFDSKHGWFNSEMQKKYTETPSEDRKQWRAIVGIKLKESGYTSLDAETTLVISPGSVNSPTGYTCDPENHSEPYRGDRVNCTVTTVTTPIENNNRRSEENRITAGGSVTKLTGEVQSFVMTPEEAAALAIEEGL